MQRLGELHLTSARESALRLVANATGVFPAEWMRFVVEDVTKDLFSFAFNARRLNDICAFNSEDFGDVSNLALAISANDPGEWVTSYREALNYLHHAEEFIFGNVHNDHRKLYTQSDNLTPMYVRVRTDRYPRGTISIFGVASCFLVSVVPRVKERFAEWSF